MENIDNLIIARLGEHQRKVDFINKNLSKRDQNTPSFRKVTYSLITIAACVTIIFTLSPMLFKQNSISDMALPAPSFTEYRGSGLNNLESLVDNKQYEEALSSVEYGLVEIDDELDSISSTDISEDEETYFKSLYMGEMEELMWCKIYLLVKLNKKKELKVACDKYLKHREFKRYSSEVKKILEKIQ